MINLSKDAVFVASGMIRGKSGYYGIRIKGIAGGCSGLYFDVAFDRKKKDDVIIKKHGALNVFADKETATTLKNATKRFGFSPATIEFAKTSLGPKFLTESRMVRINLWETDLE